MKFFTLLIVVICCHSVLASDEVEVEVKVGDKVPEFTAKDHRGEDWTVSDHIGQKMLVIYFYPADLTGGCTKQACAYRDTYAILEEEGIEVIGISGDNVRSHQLFRKAYDLPFPLLADEDGEVAKAFGVPLRKGGSIMREIDGIEETLSRDVTASRWTFVVDLNGQIVFKDTEVNAPTDSEAVLQAVRSLKDERKLTATAGSED